MKRIGIDIGSLYLGAVVLEDGEIRDVQYREHRGEIQVELENITALPVYKHFDTIGITGNFPERREGVIDKPLNHQDWGVALPTRLSSNFLPIQACCGI